MYIQYLLFIIIASFKFHIRNMKPKSGKFYNSIVHVTVIDIHISVARDVLPKTVRKYICTWLPKLHPTGQPFVIPPGVKLKVALIETTWIYKSCVLCQLYVFEKRKHVQCNKNLLKREHCFVQKIQHRLFIILLWFSLVIVVCS